MKAGGLCHVGLFRLSIGCSLRTGLRTGFAGFSEWRCPSGAMCKHFFNLPLCRCRNFKRKGVICLNPRFRLLKLGMKRKKHNNGFCPRNREIPQFNKGDLARFLTGGSYTSCNFPSVLLVSHATMRPNWQMPKSGADTCQN